VKDLLSACVIVLGVIFVYGFIRGDGRDRMRVTTISEKKLLTVVVTVPDANERYYWLRVHGCSADVTENGVYCNGERWSATSEREPGQRKQHLIPFRDCPGGTVQFTAMVFDRHGNVLAQGQHTVLR